MSLVHRGSICHPEQSETEQRILAIAMLYKKIIPGIYYDTRDFSGAGKEIRTLDLNLGKVALYH